MSNRVMEALYTVSARIAQQAAPGSRNTSGASGTASADAAQRTDAALQATVDAARDGLEALRSHIAAAATSVQDVVSGGNEETTVVGNAAPGSDTGPAELEPTEGFARWVRALNAAARAAEQAAADADAAAADAGSWFTRTSSCIEAEERVTAATTDVTRLTVGDGRPGSIPDRTGREAYVNLAVLMDDAQRRASDACDSIEQPRWIMLSPWTCGGVPSLSVHSAPCAY